MHMSWTAPVVAIGAFVGVLSATATVYASFRRRFGRPWRLLIGEPADPHTGAPSRPGMIALVFGDKGEGVPGLLLTSQQHGDMLIEHTQMLIEHTEILQAQSRVLARIEAQVTPNGGETDRLGDRVRRTEEKLDNHLAESEALSQEISADRVSDRRRINRLEREARKSHP